MNRDLLWACLFAIIGVVNAIGAYGQRNLAGLVSLIFVGLSGFMVAIKLTDWTESR